MWHRLTSAAFLAQQSRHLSRIAFKGLSFFIESSALIDKAPFSAYFTNSTGGKETKKGACHV